MSPPALLALVALLAALLAPAAPAGPRPWAGKEKTEITKGVYGLQVNKQKLYYILDKQCTGKITSKYLPCRAPRLLRVTAAHALLAPRVLVEDSLDAAYVWRAPPCRGAVSVRVEAAC